MKKVLFILLVLAAVIYFTSCSTTSNHTCPAYSVIDATETNA